MIHTQDLERTVALALASAYVEGEKPLSLMIVSDRPESGKTEVVNSFYGMKGIAILSDVTAFALWRDFGKELATGRLKHLIIPEFLAPISRGTQTVESFIATLQMLVEEGLSEIHTGFLKPIKLASPVTIGVIACLPRTAFNEHRLDWEVSGFLSRFMVITYKYDSKSVQQIFDSIEKQDYLTETRISLNFERKMSIEIPRFIARKCRVLAETITEKARKDGKCYGFRELKNILKCVAANVILDNMKHPEAERLTADYWDFKVVERLRYLFNEDFNSLNRNVSWEEIDEDAFHRRQGILLPITAEEYDNAKPPDCYMKPGCPCTDEKEWAEYGCGCWAEPPEAFRQDKEGATK